MQWLGSNYRHWLWVVRKSGFILCRLSLQVSWSSSHSEWTAAELDCHWLAWSTSARWMWCGCGRSRPLLKTNHLSTAERSHSEELKKSPEKRPQRPFPYSTTLTHAMLVHCQTKAQRHTTLLHQYLLFGDSFAIQQGQEHSSDPWWTTTKAWFSFMKLASSLSMAVQHVHVTSKTPYGHCVKRNIWNIYRYAEHPHGKVQVYSSRR